jgi:hypothetical protein
MKTQDTVKTSVRIPEVLWREAKVRCLEERRELQELVSTAVAEYLRRKPPDERREMS